MTPKTAKLIGVFWNDINFDDSWGDDDSLLQPAEAYTVGHLIVDENDYIVLGGSYSYRDERWATRHAIPKGAITDTVVYYDPEI